METNNFNKANRLYNLDFLKFILVFPVLIYHLFGDFFSKIVVNNPLISQIKLNVHNGHFAVEIFFIISGYFLYKSFLKNKDFSLKEFVKKRFLSLFPLVFISFLLILIFDFKYNNQAIHINFYNFIAQSCLLQSMGLKVGGDLLNPYAWYVSVLFWSSVFMFMLFKVFKKEQLDLILFLVIFFSLVSNFF